MTVKVPEYSLVVGIYDKGWKKTKVPTIIPFFYKEKHSPPQPVQMFNVFTLEYINSISNEEIGVRVREMLNRINEIKIKIENGEYSPPDNYPITALRG